MIYFNEIDSFAATWIQNLFPSATVDRRSIKDVDGKDTYRFGRCHFFAGIAGWEYALQLAGWPDDWPVWTGSCPCQPFSSAGKRQGESDERHLWPDFRKLIAECLPPVVFGEQVASKDGRLWLAGVRTDLEALGYALGAADLCAASVSAPHIRQRLYWVGVANKNRCSPWNSATESNGHRSAAISASGGNPERLDDASDFRRKTWRNDNSQHDRQQLSATSQSNSGLVNSNGYHSHWWSGPLQVGWNAIEAEIERGGKKYRAKWRIKPGLSIVAHGIPGRVGKVCGAGNAIVPQLAAEFIGSVIDLLS